MMSHHVSASISQLMIEQVMKLGSLASDSKFFLMVEDANGQRRVTGDNSLIRSFASGTMRPREDDLRLELDPNATTGIFEQGVNTIFDVDDSANGGNKRAGDYMDNEFGAAKRAKTGADNGRAGTNDVEGYDDECNIFVDKLPASYEEAQFKEIFAQFGEITRIKLLVDKRTGVSKCNGFILFSTPQAADAAITEMNGKVLENGSIPLYVRKAKENKKNLLQYWPGLQAMANPAIMAMATGRRSNNGAGMMGAMPGMSGGAAGMMGNAMGGGAGVGMPPPPPPSQPQNPYAGYTAQGTPGVEGVTKHTLFVYNLSADSSELDLYNLFGKFGAIIDVHLQRDLGTGQSKGFGFVAFAEYQQATAAIQGMDGYLYEKNNYKPLQVSFKNRKN